jgi:4-amino-4-deoxy-L-arabinose transferase-like glycosyltransferase
MQSNLFKEHFSLAILIGFCVLIALARLHTYDEPFERDLLTYAVMAHEMLAGRELYSDLWDQKPPGPTLTYAAAELITGYGPNSIYLLNVVATIITLFGVYFAGTALAGGKRSGGLWAAACWAILAGELKLQANQPNTEVFINACLIWTWLLFVTAEKSSGYRRAILIGLLVTLATFYKHHMIFAFIFLGMAYIIMPPPTLKRQQALIQVVIMASMVGIAWVMMFGYFAVMNRFEAFYDALVVFNQSYGGGSFGSLIKNVLRGLLKPHLFFPIFPALAYPLLVLATILGILILIKQNRLWIFWLMYACAIPIMVSLPGRFFPHYYQLWLPLLAIGFGGAIVELRKIVNPFWIPQLIATLVIVTLLYLQLPYYQLSPVEWTRQKYGDYGNFFIIAKELSYEIDKLLQADETFYEWGYQTGLYYYNKRHPPTGVFPHYALSGGPLAQKLSQRVIADLEHHQPELFILSHDITILQTVLYESLILDNVVSYNDITLRI